MTDPFARTYEGGGEGVDFEAPEGKSSGGQIHGGQESEGPAQAVACHPDGPVWSGMGFQKLEQRRPRAFVAAVEAMVHAAGALDIGQGAPERSVGVQATQADGLKWFHAIFI